VGGCRRREIRSQTQDHRPVGNSQTAVARSPRGREGLA
jgi:hypothetical protein